MPSLHRENEKKRHHHQRHHQVALHPLHRSASHLRPSLQRRHLLNNQCLLIMSTTDHAIAWHWCRQKTTTAYKTAAAHHPTTTDHHVRRWTRNILSDHLLLAHHQNPTIHRSHTTPHPAPNHIHTTHRSRQSTLRTLTDLDRYRNPGTSSHVDY